MSSQAGELDEFIKEDVKKWYPELINLSRVSIIEIAPKIMPSYSADIQDYVRHVEDDFKKRDIKIIRGMVDSYHIKLFLKSENFSAKI